MMVRGIRTDTEDLPLGPLDRGILRSKDPCRHCRILLWAAIITVLVLTALSLQGCGEGLFRPVPPEAPPAPPVDPLHAWLVYGVLVGIIGVGVGVALFIWLPFKKTAAAVVGGSGAIVATCLTVRSVLPYIGWVVLAGAVITAIAFLWHFRRTLACLKESWYHVPDDAPVAPKMEALIDRITK